MPNKLKIIAKPCGSATCPTLYRDTEGRLFLQGAKLTVTERQDIAVGEHEEVVEIDTSLLDALRAL